MQNNDLNWWARVQRGLYAMTFGWIAGYMARRLHTTFDLLEAGFYKEGADQLGLPKRMQQLGWMHRVCLWLLPDRALHRRYYRLRALFRGYVWRESVEDLKIALALSDTAQEQEEIWPCLQHTIEHNESLCAMQAQAAFGALWMSCDAYLPQSSVQIDVLPDDFEVSAESRDQRALVEI